MDFEIECTYNQPSNRKKQPDLGRVENRLKCAETILEALLPGVDIFNEGFNMPEFVNKLKRSRISIIPVNNEIDEGTGLPKGSNGSVGFENDHIFSPQSTPNIGSSPHDIGREIKIILPPKHIASELIEAVWENACVLFRFYHRPSFIRDLDLLYETEPEDYTNKQYKILPLVYSIMAVGVLFSMDKCEKLGFNDVSEGYKYFVAARKLIDIADARDTYAIQSIVMMIIFLQCSARLSTCYSYIGVALRSSLRAGLHRKVGFSFNPIELETRKRLFWTIRKMDIYVNAMLGLPRSISEEDFDQELPEEIDDENITEDAYFPQSPGKISSAGIANAHTRLITILSHIMKHIYPVKSKSNNTHQKVPEMEAEINEWINSLPLQLRPDTIPPAEYFKANRLLNLALCHVQIVLYRPFIHYCSPKFRSTSTSQTKSALNCISVSRRAMYLAHELTSRNLLNGAYWFSIYTIFFSVACLVYYVHENPNDPEADAIRKDAEVGKNALTMLKESSMAAKRTYNLLNTLFEQLNRRTAKIPSADSAVSGINTQSQFNSAVESDNSIQPLNSRQASQISFGASPMHSTTLNKTATEPLGKRQRITPSTPVFSSTPSLVTAAITTPNSQFVEPKFNPPTNNPRTKSGALGTGIPVSAPMIESFSPITSTSSVTADNSPQAYLPGIMDQVDAQLFGRFLPQYMMPEKNGQQQTTEIWDNVQQAGDIRFDTAAPAPEATLDGNNSTITQDPLVNGERKFSLSDMFNGQSKEWDELLGQHHELSGVNSFM